MSLFSSILVPLDGSITSARSLGCATWLATAFDARLHVLSATSRQLSAGEELRRLNVAEEHWPRMELHRAPEYAEAAILRAVVDHGVELIVMTARGATADEPSRVEAELPRLVGHVTQAVIERCPVPVLLLPPRYREDLPWERVLVPVSGELESDDALVLASRLATPLDLSVHVAHVAASSVKDGDLEARARYSDAVHHEYSAQLHGLVGRAAPSLWPEQCRRIEDIALAHGDVIVELLKLIQDKRPSVLVLGWHGRFMTGRAEVLKGLLSVIETPVLLVKSATRPRSRLKVGEEFE